MGPGVRPAYTILAATILSLWLTTSAAGAVASDDFERHLLGPNWIVLGGSGSVGILDQSDLGLANGPSRGGALEWGADSFLADQFSEAMISPERIDSMLTQVFVRHRTSDNARYGFHWNNAFGGRWEIKYDGVPTAQTRIVASLVAPEPLPGDRIRIEARGARISGFHNGTLILSAEDTAPDAIMATGGLGVVFRFTTTFPASYPSAVFESWSGGDLADVASVDPSASGHAPLVSFWPHPIVGRSSVDISEALSHMEGLGFSLFDAGGRLLGTQDVHEGREFVLDGAGMPSGIYFYRLRSGNRTLARGRLVIVGGSP